MKFMLFFWVTFLLMIILVIMQHFSKEKSAKNILNSVSIALMILAFSFLIIAVATKDPLFKGFGVPQEYEWVVGFFLVGLSSWKLYFNPLKERVINVEKKISSLDSGVKTGFSSIKEDLTLIKNKLINNK